VKAGNTADGNIVGHFGFWGGGAHQFSRRHPRTESELNVPELRI
jgi:hypothetical protein